MRREDKVSCAVRVAQYAVRVTQRVTVCRLNFMCAALSGSS